MADRKIQVQSGTSGFLWFSGWMFTIGFLKTTFLKGVLALLLWPYMLGAHFAGYEPEATQAIEEAVRAE